MDPLLLKSPTRLTRESVLCEQGNRQRRCEMGYRGKMRWTGWRDEHKRKELGRAIAQHLDSEDEVVSTKLKTLLASAA